jgi:hypothetical protein
MTKSKKVFAAAAVVFLILLIFASYDISRRTTFPGSKPQLKERLKQTYGGKDTLKSDSLAPKSPKN